MKKIFCTIITYLSILQADALLITQYKPVAKKFSSSTDLIRGMILLNKGSLFEQRHYGLYKYNGQDEGNNDAVTCSIDDAGLDAMSRLIKNLFPSTGGSGLNAMGRGSLTDEFKGEEQDKLIAGMFKIANEVRNAITIYREKGEDLHNIAMFKDIRAIHEFNLDEKIDFFDKIKAEHQNLSTAADTAKSKLDELVSLMPENVPDSTEIPAENMQLLNEKKAELEAIFEKIQKDRREYVDIFPKKKDRNSRITTEDIQKQIEDILRISSVCDELKRVIEDLQTKHQLNREIRGSLCKLIVGFDKKIEEGKDFGKKSLVGALVSIVSSMKRVVTVSEKENQKANSRNLSNLFELKKQLVKKYFQIDENGKVEKLLMIAELTAGAVLQERFHDEKDISKDVTERPSNMKSIVWNRPYFPGYTNDLICAYVCSTYSGERSKLEQLAKTINKFTGLTPYENTKDKDSELTTMVCKTIKPESSVIPFYVNHHIITNGSAHWKNIAFADCVETAVRQLFALVFSKVVVKDGENELEAAEERIPSDELKMYFAKKNKQGIFEKNIRYIANDGHRNARDAWAKICSNRPGVKYEHSDGGEKYELKSGWENIIRVFCSLMEKYPEMLAKRQNGVTQQEKDAADLILNINNGSPIDDREKTLSTLLGIRTDVDLKINKSHSDFYTKNKGIAIIQAEKKDNDNLNSQEQSKDKDKDKYSDPYNVLDMRVQDDHAYFNPIDVSTDDFSTKKFKSTDLWYIANLYNNGKKLFFKYDYSLTQTQYPLLEFFWKIKLYTNSHEINSLRREIKSFFDDVESSCFIRGMARLTDAEIDHFRGLCDHVIDSLKEDQLLSFIYILGKNTKNNKLLGKLIFKALIYNGNNKNYANQIVEVLSDKVLNILNSQKSDSERCNVLKDIIEGFPYNKSIQLTPKSTEIIKICIDMALEDERFMNFIDATASNIFGSVDFDKNNVLYKSFEKYINKYHKPKNKRPVKLRLPVNSIDKFALLLPVSLISNAKTELVHDLLKQLMDASVEISFDTAVPIMAGCSHDDLKILEKMGIPKFEQIITPKILGIVADNAVMIDWIIKFLEKNDLKLDLFTASKILGRCSRFDEKSEYFIKHVNTILDRVNLRTDENFSEDVCTIMSEICARRGNEKIFATKEILKRFPNKKISIQAANPALKEYANQLKAKTFDENLSEEAKKFCETIDFSLPYSYKRYLDLAEFIRLFAEITLRPNTISNVIELHPAFSLDEADQLISKFKISDDLSAKLFEKLDYSTFLGNIFIKVTNLMRYGGNRVIEQIAKRTTTCSLVSLSLILTVPNPDILLYFLDKVNFSEWSSFSNRESLLLKILKHKDRKDIISKILKDAKAIPLNDGLMFLKELDNRDEIGLLISKFLSKSYEKDKIKQTILEEYKGEKLQIIVDEFKKAGVELGL